VSEQASLPDLDAEEFAPWVRAVRDEPPKLLDLAELYCLLTAAAELDKRGTVLHNLPPGMTGPERALQAVTRFLLKQPQMRSGAVAPLIRLLAAMGDLANGTVSPMFQPRQRPRGQPHKAQANAAVIGLAARTLTELMNAGEKEENAARRVASVLKERAATIKNWRRTILRSRSELEAAAAYYHEPLPPPDLGDTPGDRAKNLLTRLAARAQGLRYGAAWE
jgi:hypothetical protein